MLTSPPIIYLHIYDFLGIENFYAAFNRARRLKGKTKESRAQKYPCFRGVFKKADSINRKQKHNCSRESSAAADIFVSRIAFANAIIHASNWTLQLTLLKICRTLWLYPILISFMHPSWIDIIFHLVKRDSFLPRRHFNVYTSLHSHFNFSLSWYRILTSIHRN